MHWARRAASRAAWTAGKSRAISTAMIAITTSSSIRVNPRDERRGDDESCIGKLFLKHLRYNDSIRESSRRLRTRIVDRMKAVAMSGDGIRARIVMECIARVEPDDRRPCSGGIRGLPIVSDVPASWPGEHRRPWPSHEPSGPRPSSPWSPEREWVHRSSNPAGRKHRRRSQHPGPHSKSGFGLHFISTPLLHDDLSEPSVPPRHGSETKIATRRRATRRRFGISPR